MAAAATCTVLAVFLAVTFAQRFDEPVGRRKVEPHARFNYFDYELLREALMQNGLHNMVVSPASAKAVLAMLHEGAGGETANQIGGALRLDEGHEVSRRRFKEFLQSLKVNREGLEVHIGNTLFASPDTKIRREYQDVLEEYFLTRVQTADFGEPHVAAATINDWVAKNTRNYIRNLIDPKSLSQATKAVVVNALFFKGKWTVPFDPRATTSRSFCVSPSVCKEVKFMESLGYYNYAVIKGLNAEAAEVPYQGNKFSMLFLRPSGSMEQMLRDLPSVPLNDVIRQLDKTNLQLYIPRFSIEYESDLIPTLKQMGIKDIFQPSANFTGMIESSGGVYINKFLQKTVIEITEEGTAGASATAAAAVPLVTGGIQKFRLDKPFLFFLRDLETGTFLFEGLVEQPELAKGGETLLPNGGHVPGKQPSPSNGGRFPETQPSPSNGGRFPETQPSPSNGGDFSEPFVPIGGGGVLNPVGGGSRKPERPGSRPDIVNRNDETHQFTQSSGPVFPSDTNPHGSRNPQLSRRPGGTNSERF